MVCRVSLNKKEELLFKILHEKKKKKNQDGILRGTFHQKKKSGSYDVYLFNEYFNRILLVFKTLNKLKEDFRFWLRNQFIFGVEEGVGLVNTVLFR